jgi:7-carboxy-7-deazaguanine synthase
MVQPSSAELQAGLLVSEIFGPTFQGEGRQQGQRCAFVRLGTCNLSCSFCDTPYTWAYTERQAAKHRDGKMYDPKQELRRMSVEEVASRVEELLPIGGLVVFSGGEPMLQESKIDAVVDRLLASFAGIYTFAIETAGTIKPQSRLRQLTPDTIQWTVSLKLHNSGNSRNKRERPDAIYAFRGLGADFKFVVKDIFDIDEVQQIVEHYHIPPTWVWLMPEGTDPVGLLSLGVKVANCALAAGWNFTQRMHVLLWGNERGH